MSQTLNIPNFSSLNIINDSNTQLTGSIAAAADSLPVQDVDDFNNDGYVLVGLKGSSTAELLQSGDIVTATDIPLQSDTALAHNQYDPVYPLFGNNINIYRAQDAGQGLQPADSAFTLLDTIAIDYSNPATSYTDSTGSGDYWYKFTYFNSATSAETSLAFTTATRGIFTVAYCDIDDIREEAGFANSPFITDSKLDLARQAAQAEIDGALNVFYDVPLQPPISSYLQRICIRLAAGFARQAQYSSNQNPQVNGQTMVDDGEAQLQKLILKERELMTANGKALDGPGASGGIEGWPNQATAYTARSQGGAPRVFRMGDIQGQPYATDSSGNPVGNLYYGRKY